MGDLFVCIETDPKAPVASSEIDRLYMLQSINYVHNVRISAGFEASLNDIKPDIFFTNKNDQTRKAIVTKMNIQYVLDAQSDKTDDEKVEKANNNDKDMKILQLQAKTVKLEQYCRMLKQSNDSLQSTNMKLTKQMVTLGKDNADSILAIAQLSAQLEEKETPTDLQEDPNEVSCALCFGLVDADSLVVIKECDHTFHSQCMYQSLQADIGIYQRMPVCSVCDGDGTTTMVPQDVATRVIQGQAD
eukprot:40988_1